MYFGDRKSGCRFYEFIFKGYRSLYIENDCIRTVLLLDKGTDVISFVDKKTDTEFVWTNPMGLSCLDRMREAKMDSDCFSDNYLGGWFEILPNVGQECKVMGKHLPNHSEISYLPWEYTVIEDSAEKIKILLLTRLSKYPIEVRKYLTVKRDEPTLYFDEEIINIGSTDLPYLWGFHPNVGKPFLNENCIVDLPFAKEIFEMPPEGSNRNGIWYFENVDVAYGCIYDKKTGLGLKMTWDNRFMKHCWLWISAGYDKGHHHHGGTYVCCILPTSAKSSKGLEKSIDDCETIMIESGRIHRHSFSIGVTRRL